VRKDLSRSQQAVQAGHAVAEWLLEYRKENLWDNGILVYLKAGNSEEALEHFYNNLYNDDRKIATFYEPDIGVEMTAFAILGTDDIPDMLNDFRLL